MLATTHAIPSAAAPSAPARATPIEAHERLPALDVIRGLALVAMILVHFHQLMREESAGLQRLVGWAIWILAEEKAWGTFALLFGAGFGVLLRRLEGRADARTRVAPVVLRRLAALFAIGVAIERGTGFHILTTYAVCGLVLFVVRGWSTRALLRTVVVAAMFPPALNAVVGFAAQATGSAFPLLRAVWWLIPDSSLPLSITGLLAVRLGVADDPLGHVRLVRGWMLFGVASWLVSWLVLYHVPRPPERFMSAYWAARTVIGLVDDQWLCFTYAGGALLLLAQRPRLVARLGPIAAAGRMALTNYVLQAVTIWYLAKPMGIRLHEGAYVGAWLVLAATLVVFSALWLARFRHGPLEWLWRMATYARREPLRRDDGEPVARATAACASSPGAGPNAARAAAR